MTRSSVGIVAVALAVSCEAGRAPPRDPVAVLALPPPAPPPEPAAPPAPPAPESSVPLLGLEVFAPAGVARPKSVFKVEGALVVVAEDKRIGRVVGDSIEWLDKRLPHVEHWDDAVIARIHGRWPDRLDLLYHSTSGRWVPSLYVPLTGKGRPQVIGAIAGAGGTIYGIATIGETTFITASSVFGGATFLTVRGPALPRWPKSEAAAGCPPTSYPPSFALAHAALEATEDGTLVAVGRPCSKGVVGAAEIWDKGSRTSRIVDLSAWVKTLYGGKLLRGHGDELFLFVDEKTPILAFKAGAFAPVPALEKPVESVFVSAEGKLHASDGATIHRLDDGRWTPIARLAWPTRFDTMAIEGDALWAARGDTVFRLRPTPGVEYREGCSTPFVYLYQSNPSNGDRYTYPTTKKALSSFPRASEIELVEFRESVLRLGVVVKSKADGEAVIDHIRAHMKEESPTLLCYQPSSPRKLELKPRLP